MSAKRGGFGLILLQKARLPLGEAPRVWARLLAKEHMHRTTQHSAWSLTKTSSKIIQALVHYE